MRNIKSIRNYMLVLVIATTVLSVVAVPYVNAQPYNKAIKDIDKLTCALTNVENKMRNILSQKEIKTIEDNIGILDPHPGMAHEVATLFVWIVYEIFAVATGHNAFTQAYVFALTILFTIPMCFLGDIIMMGGLSLPDNLLEFFLQLYMKLGIIGIILAPFLAIFAIVIALLEGTGQAVEALVESISGVYYDAFNMWYR